MHLTILGNNGPYPQVGGATSGYLLEISGKKLLLDCGSGVFSNLLKEVKIAELSAIIISHLHFDHISDLGVLSYYINANLSKKIKLYLPDTNPYIEQILKSNAYEVEFYQEGNLKIDSIDIIATQVLHPVKTFALTFKGEKVFTYTADTNFCPQVEKLFANSNTLLCDACFLESNWASGKPHMSVKGICELAKKFNSKVILTHLNPQTDIKEYQSQAFGNYHLAQIGDKIEI
jgi:ribonuclease BN (tRNA processing enzyme)